jgi:hypothetical protein
MFVLYIAILVIGFFLQGLVPHADYLFGPRGW